MGGSWLWLILALVAIAAAVIDLHRLLRAVDRMGREEK